MGVDGFRDTEREQRQCITHSKGFLEVHYKYV